MIEQRTMSAAVRNPLVNFERYDSDDEKAA